MKDHLTRIICIDYNDDLFLAATFDLLITYKLIEEKIVKF